MITLHSRSSAEIRRAAAESKGSYTLIAIGPDRVVSVNTRRLDSIAADTGAAMLYGNYRRDGVTVPLIEYRRGSVRDDFDFGPVVMVRTDLLREFAAGCPDYDAAGFYALRLFLSLHGPLLHVNETVSEVSSTGDAAPGEKQFNYVDPRNRAVQVEMERAFTEWLARAGALVAPGKPIDHSGTFPVEASVIIPVRNREATVGSAIRSALDQLTEFPFNVIVVNNHSSDSTAEVIDSFAATDPRVIHIVPEPGHGIGGCWNVALDSPCCGRFAVQLDSDDVYSSPNTLAAIVAKFRETGAAMVIGSYTLTDFDLNVIPPGLIDHAEWTDANGANNALRINGLGAPRAFFTPLARSLRFPDTCYGEDYAMALRICRQYRIARIFDSLYFCRRWGGNSDSNLPQEKINANNRYKDFIRSVELAARINGNKNRR